MAKVFNEAIRVTMSRAMYSFSQFFPLGFWGVLMRHMHFARSAQGGVLGNLEGYELKWARLRDPSRIRRSCLLGVFGSLYTGETPHCNTQRNRSIKN